MAKRPKARASFRCTKTLFFLAVGVTVLFSSLLAHTVRSHGLTWEALAFGALTAMAAAGVAEVLWMRVTLEPDAILIRARGSKRRIDRAEIETVTWEAGAGVALRLKNGSWVKLPDTGHGSMGVANSVRAWLRRTGVESQESPST